MNKVVYYDDDRITKEYIKKQLTTDGNKARYNPEEAIRADLQDVRQPPDDDVWILTMSVVRSVTHVP